jgi:putative addiction module component (TIGR02574 family)
MALQKSKMFEEVRKLPPIERAELIEDLLESFNNTHRKKIDELWAQEAESRINAYNSGQIEALPISKVFERIEKEDI